MNLLDRPISGTFDIVARPGAPVHDVSAAPTERADLDRDLDVDIDRDPDRDPADPDATLRSPARCADGNGTLTHLFFSDDEFDIARAKAICSKCGRASQCLGDALDRAEAYGVWGGELLVDGVVISVKRGRGRPPKHPRPPLVVDEVPLPPHLVA
jgi:WhiB family redox-sensing transcriptional regulator